MMDGRLAPKRTDVAANIGLDTARISSLVDANSAKILRRLNSSTLTKLTTVISHLKELCSEEEILHLVNLVCERGDDIIHLVKDHTLGATAQALHSGTEMADPLSSGFSEQPAPCYNLISSTSSHNLPRVATHEQIARRRSHNQKRHRRGGIKSSVTRPAIVPHSAGPGAKCNKPGCDGKSIYSTRRGIREHYILKHSTPREQARQEAHAIFTNLEFAAQPHNAAPWSASITATALSNVDFSDPYQDQDPLLAGTGSQFLDVTPAMFQGNDIRHENFSLNASQSQLHMDTQSLNEPSSFGTDTSFSFPYDPSPSLSFRKSQNAHGYTYGYNARGKAGHSSAAASQSMTSFSANVEDYEQGGASVADDSSSSFFLM